MQPAADHCVRLDSPLSAFSGGVDVQSVLRGGGSEEAIVALFVGATGIKPEGHQLDRLGDGPGDNRMQEFGG